MAKVWFYKAAEAPPLRRRVDEMVGERGHENDKQVMDQALRYIKQTQRELSSVSFINDGSREGRALGNIVANHLENALLDLHSISRKR